MSFLIGLLVGLAVGYSLHAIYASHSVSGGSPTLLLRIETELGLLHAKLNTLLAHATHKNVGTPTGAAGPLVAPAPHTPPMG